MTRLHNSDVSLNPVGNELPREFRSFSFPINYTAQDNTHNHTVTAIRLLKATHIHSSGSFYMAYFLVHSLANWLYLCLSALKSLAISGTRGSSGLGSHNNEQMERRTLDTVRAGDHCDLRISKQILPLEFMFGWYIFVEKATLGGVNG